MSRSGTPLARPGSHGSLAQQQTPPRTKMSWEITSSADTEDHSSGLDDDYKYSHAPLHLMQPYQNNPDRTIRNGGGGGIPEWRQQQQQQQQQQRQPIPLFQMEQPSLEEVHRLHRKPHFVPDGHYKDYMNGIIKRQKAAGFVTQRRCAMTCAGFSCAGFLFLLFVGIIFDTQPLFIKGGLEGETKYTDDATRPVLQYLIPGKHSMRLPEAQAAYHAALAYAWTFLLSIYLAFPGWFHQQWNRRFGLYQAVPDATDPDTVVASGRNLAHSIPLHGQQLDGDTGAARDAEAYQHMSQFRHMLDRLKGTLQQWLAVKGWMGKYTPVRNRRKGMQKTV